MSPSITKVSSPQFAAEPKASHGRAIRHLSRYLAGTKDKGLIIKPDLSKGFKVWVDSDFCSIWNEETVPTYPSTARSHTGYVITYAGCLASWISCLQTYVAHSSSKADYDALREALRDTIPMMRLLEEAAAKGIPLSHMTLTFHCTVVEDNSGCIELANIPKLQPRTRHINLKYHHFQEYIMNKSIMVKKRDGDNQLADQLTKPLAADKFFYLQQGFLGW
jgi:hypothetical protein